MIGIECAFFGTLTRDADHRMFVPIAGPWMALFDRGDCGGTTGRSSTRGCACTNDSARRSWVAR